jgi:hypothetical protein
MGRGATPSHVEDVTAEVDSQSIQLWRNPEGTAELLGNGGDQRPSPPQGRYGVSSMWAAIR